MNTEMYRQVLGQLRVALKDNDPTLGVSTYLVEALVCAKYDRDYPKRAETLRKDHPWLRTVLKYDYRVWAPREDWIKQALSLGIRQDDIARMLLTLEET